MAENRKKPEDSSICMAVLQTAAARGWLGVSFVDVSGQCQVSVMQLRRRFIDVEDMAAFVVQETGRIALDKFKPVGSEHDILFDIIMSRFEIIQQNRKGVLAIADAAIHDKKLAKAMASALFKSMQEFADASCIKRPRFALVLGLLAVYGWAFNAWRKDKSADMAKTMAALDKALRFAGNVAAVFK